MLKDVNKQELKKAKQHALELVQDIEQMELMLQGEDTHETVIQFNQGVMHEAFMNALGCTGIFQKLDAQAYIGTHLESKRTEEEKAEIFKAYQIEEAKKILLQHGVTV